MLDKNLCESEGGGRGFKGGESAGEVPNVSLSSGASWRKARRRLDGRA
jgi:hypothetical protein